MRTALEMCIVRLSICMHTNCPALVTRNSTHKIALRPPRKNAAAHSASIYLLGKPNCRRPMT